MATLLCEIDSHMGKAGKISFWCARNIILQGKNNCLEGGVTPVYCQSHWSMKCRSRLLDHSECMKYMNRTNTM